MTLAAILVFVFLILPLLTGWFLWRQERLCRCGKMMKQVHPVPAGPVSALLEHWACPRCGHTKQIYDGI